MVMTRPATLVILSGTKAGRCRPSLTGFEVLGSLPRPPERLDGEGAAAGLSPLVHGHGRNARAEGNAVKLDVRPGRDAGPHWTRSGAGLLSISSVTCYQFGRDKPGKSDADVVGTDRESPEVVTADRKSRRRPVTGYGCDASLAGRPGNSAELNGIARIGCFSYVLMLSAAAEVFACRPP